MTATARSAPHPLYPLRFEPIYQYRPWGGRRLGELLSAPLPAGLVGEAWLLSDREDHQSRVADGPLSGQTIAELRTKWPTQLLGSFAERFPRFPLLLKFLDARQVLSVQVHPSDREAAEVGPGESGKTEAWVVLEASPDSFIYAGLKKGTTAEDLRAAVAGTTISDCLASFIPHVGDGVLLPAGTVHALGSGMVVFEVQQNSDLTYRLFDWGRADPETGQRRELHVDQALACTDFAAGPVVPVVADGEDLLHCAQFGVRRCDGAARVQVGAQDTARVLVCLSGEGDLAYDDRSFPLRKGDVVLIPAVVGVCEFQPNPTAILLEVSLPEVSTP
jgi:mannose-6-phosphate isomerase